MEVVVQSLDDALQAESAGADRLEVCCAIELGGLTPSIGLIKSIKGSCGLPIRALIRCRAGSFIYDANEKTAMLDDAVALLDAGADGLVVGGLALGAEGLAPDIAFVRDLKRVAQDRPMTFHRAFDQCSDPVASMHTLADLGTATILTSGCSASAADGAAMLARLVREANGKVEVLAAGGIRSSNVANLIKAAGMTSVHCGPFTSVNHGDNDSHSVSRGFPQLRLDASEVAKIAALTANPVTRRLQ